MKGNTVVTIFFQNDIRKPDIVLANSVRSYESLGHKTIMVENYDEGMIRWYTLEVRIFYHSLEYLIFSNHRI
jgi:hypothetical protein